MLEELEDVPPAIQLLINEVARCGSLVDARKRVKSILPELKAQAASFQAATPGEISTLRDAKVFDIHLHGALDIISGSGCASLDCRVAAADRIARSVGLIADRIWLTDTITYRLESFGRTSNEKIDALVEDALVISRLAPFISAGIVKFRHPYYATCEACAAKLTGDVSSTASALHKKFKRDFRLEPLEDCGYIAHTGQCFEPPMYLTDPFDSVLPDINDFIADRIQQELRSILYVAREASLTGGSIVSNSRLGMAGLLQQDGRLGSKRSLMILEREREVGVPWISELSPKQVVQLREEASTALPAFRSQLTKIFSFENQGSTTPAAAIDMLRDQAIEVRAELEAKQKHSSRYWKVTYGLLGLGLSVYGLASENSAASISGILPLIQLLISHQTGYETDIAKLTTRPGYVLMKAQDILSHAH
jgi:hypothetical protein